MTAPEALKAARSAGIKIGLDGDDLVLEASAPPPAAVIDALSRHKAGVVALLRRVNDKWSTEGIVENNGLHGESVARWAAKIDRLATLPAVSPEGAEALKRAQAFIAEGWALQTARLGWDEIELFGICPRAPWRRLDRKGAAFGGAVQAVTAEAVVYVGGTRRYRAIVNNDGGAVPIWELVQNNQTNGGHAT